MSSLLLNRLSQGGTAVLLAIASFFTALPDAMANPSEVSQFHYQTSAIDRQPNERYEQLVQRVLSYAAELVTEQFNDPSRDYVQFTVIARNGSLSAPIIRVDVFRSEWASAPAIQQWARYFGESYVLLGFEGTPPPSPTRSEPVRFSNDEVQEPSPIENTPPLRRTVISRDVIPGGRSPASPTASPTVGTITDQNTRYSQEPTHSSTNEIERLRLPTFPRRSNRFRLTESGRLLEVETIQR